MGYTVTGPQMNITLGQGASSGMFTKQEIDGFLSSLPLVSPNSHTVDVSGNSGSLECDISIATQKGYIVIN